MIDHALQGITRALLKRTQFDDAIVARLIYLVDWSLVLRADRQATSIGWMISSRGPELEPALVQIGYARAFPKPKPGFMTMLGRRAEERSDVSPEVETEIRRIIAAVEGMSTSQIIRLTMSTWPVMTAAGPIPEGPVDLKIPKREYRRLMPERAS